MKFCSQWANSIIARKNGTSSVAGTYLTHMERQLEKRKRKKRKRKRKREERGKERKRGKEIKKQGVVFLFLELEQRLAPPKMLLLILNELDARIKAFWLLSFENG